MNYSIQKCGDVFTILVESDIDSNNVDEFDASLHELIASGHTKLILDLSRTGYIVSQGIGVIASSVQTARLQGGDIKLSGPNSRVRKIFDIARLTKLVEIHETEAEALGAFRGMI